jgi:3-oxoacid CoA-transferase subunit B
VIVTMEHTTKSGEPKILRRCRLPLTGLGVVHTIITELAVMQVSAAGLVLEEVSPGLKPEDVQSVTEARLIFGSNL